MIQTLRYMVVVGVIASGAAGCAGGGKMSQPDATLYQRLGEKPAITAVVDDFVGRVAADDRINRKFAGANLPRLKAMLVDQICQAAGGPCTYRGRDMKSAHAGMAITADEFNALVEDLVATLNAFKVPAKEREELLAVLGPMQQDIVQRM